MRRIAARFPDRLWKSIQWYARSAGMVDPTGAVHVSEAVRDLVTRGLVTDRTHEAGYRSGYDAGRAAAYAEFMRRVGAVSGRGTP